MHAVRVVFGFVRLGGPEDAAGRGAFEGFSNLPCDGRRVRRDGGMSTVQLVPQAAVDRVGLGLEFRDDLVELLVIHERHRGRVRRKGQGEQGARARQSVCSGCLMVSIHFFVAGACGARCVPAAKVPNVMCWRLPWCLPGGCSGAHPLTSGNLSVG